MSNILSVFSPPPSRDLTGEETKDCLPCQVMATVSALGAGAWFASGKVFEDDLKLTKEESLKKNPIWWRNTIRSSGYLLIAFGIYRGTEGWLWNKENEYKKF